MLAGQPVHRSRLATARVAMVMFGAGLLGALGIWGLWGIGQQYVYQAEAQELRSEQLLLELDNRLLKLELAARGAAVRRDRTVCVALVREVNAVDAAFSSLYGQAKRLRGEVEPLRRDWQTVKSAVRTACPSSAGAGDAPVKSDLVSLAGRLQPLTVRIAEVERRQLILAVERRARELATAVAVTAGGALFLGLVALTLGAAARGRARGSKDDSFEADDVSDSTISGRSVGPRVAGEGDLGESLPAVRPSEPRTPDRGSRSRNALRTLEGLKSTLQTEIEAARERNRPVAVLLLDFALPSPPREDVEEMNARIVEAIQREILPTECVARLGASRYLVLLSDTSRAIGLVVGQRLRDSLIGHVPGLAASGEPGVLLRLGLGVFPEDGGTAESVIAAAEGNLPGDETAAPFRVPEGEVAELAADLSAAGKDRSRSLGSSTLFGRFLVSRGLLTEKELATAVRVQMELEGSLASTALEAGLISLRQFRECRAYQRQKGIGFAEAVVALGFVSEADVNQLNAAARQLRTRLGEILIRAGCIAPPVLESALSDFRRLRSAARDRRPPDGPRFSSAALPLRGSRP